MMFSSAISNSEGISVLSPLFNPGRGREAPFFKLTLKAFGVSPILWLCQ